MEFTYKDHLKYIVGDRPFDYRETSIDKYTVSVGTVDAERYVAGSFVTELYRTAQLVKNDLGNDLVLFLSGGTDSEIVLRNFVHIGFKPRCVSIRFENDYNAGEIAEAKAITNELGVKLDIIDFNVHEFYYSGEAAEFGKEIQCTQLTYLMVYKNILDLGAAAVMGGEALLTRHVDVNNSFWYYTFRENEDASAMRFSKKFKIPLVNEWFSYTPELLLHYLETPRIQNLVSDRFNYKLNSASSKNRILFELYPYTRPKNKLHGFERLLAFNLTAFKDIASYQIKRLESSIDGIPYDTAIKQLKGQL